MFRYIKNFRKKTHEEYQKEQEEKMEPWKKHVRKLHEDSGFLFYYENCELEKPDGSQLIIQGDIAKDESFHTKMPLYLYDGQGRLLGEGILMSDPLEKEEKRRGFLRSRKHEFLLKITKLSGKSMGELDQRERKKLLGILFQDISLVADIKK